jgi:hypothetical protein
MNPAMNITKESLEKEDVPVFGDEDSTETTFAHLRYETLTSEHMTTWQLIMRILSLYWWEFNEMNAMRLMAIICQFLAPLSLQTILLYVRYCGYAYSS